MTHADSSNARAMAQRIAALRRPLLITHSKPDGDALGAVLAAAMFLRELGASPLPVIFDPGPDRYRFLNALWPFPVFGAQITESDLHSVDGVLILDTCSFNQIEPLSAWLKQSTLPKLVIDHHVTRDDLADQFWIDETAAATCVLLYELARAAEWTVSPAIATALFVGVATDTGWFRHSNTDARTLAVASDLAARGANPNELHRKLYQQETLGRFRLRGYAAAQTVLHAEGRLAVTTIPRSAFVDCGAAIGDTEDLVNEPLQIESVVVSVMFVEHDNGLVRMGFRSKHPMSAAEPDIDVAAFARLFGGGGHVRASGARLKATIDDAMSIVVPRLIECFAS